MISLYGSASSMAKASVQQTKVEQKKREGFVKEGGLMVKHQKTPEELQKEQLRKDAENAEKNRKMLEMEGKVQSGKKLSAEEEKYLRETSPDLYRDYMEVQAEKENYKEKLKSCKTKEEVDRTKMFEMSKAFSSVKEVTTNPNIPESAKIGMLQKIMGQVMGVAEVDTEFKESLRYQQLIDTDEEKREVDKKTREELTGQDAVNEAQEKIREESPKTEEKLVDEVQEVKAVGDDEASAVKVDSAEDDLELEKKRRKPAFFREDIHVDFDGEDLIPTGDVTVQDVVTEIINYVNDHRGTGEGLGMLQGNAGFFGT